MRIRRPGWIGAFALADALTASPAAAQAGMHTSDRDDIELTGANIKNGARRWSSR